MNGILAGVTVALKQSVPDNDLTVFMLSIKVKVIILQLVRKIAKKPTKVQKYLEIIFSSTILFLSSTCHH